MDSGTASQWQFTRAKQGSQKTYASGKWAIADCDRCGWKYPWKALATEPGTGWKVCPTCNDKGWSLVAHPQNYPAVGTDTIALPWTRPEGPHNQSIWTLFGSFNGTGDDSSVILFGNGIIGLGLDSGNQANGPFYLATENGYVITWDQDYIIQTGVSGVNGSTEFPNQLNWQSPPFGYQD